ncbi:TFIIH subunit TTDA/Tfb5 [Delphinella strobiligena]|nr:TFIIH subunit TTDA/Tfb5 [Delphinella strobiligena]
MPRAIPGFLVQCDPSIKAILNKINEENGNVFIQEDIDDETVLIHTKKLEELKQRLRDALKDTVREAEDSSSE